MSVDVESRLAELCALWDETATEIDISEIVGRPERELRELDDLDDFEVLTLVSATVGRGRRIVRPATWLLAGCAVLVAVLVAALIWWRFDPSAEPVVPVDTGDRVIVAGESGGWLPAGRLEHSCPNDMGMWRCGAVLLSDGRLLVLDSTAVGFYEPATATFRAAAEADFEGGYDRAAQLPDGRVVLTSPAGRVGLFDPVTEKLMRLDTRFVPEGQGFMTTEIVPVVLTDGEVMLFTSLDGGPVTGFALDLKNGGLSEVATASGDGEVLGAFPHDTSVIVAARGWVDVYDSATRTFTASFRAPVLEGSSVTMLVDGRLLIAGGLTASFDNPVPTNNAFIVDPA